MLGSKLRSMMEELTIVAVVVTESSRFNRTHPGVANHQENMFYHDSEDLPVPFPASIQPGVVCWEKSRRRP